MGFLSKFEKQVPSTAEDPEAITAAVHLGNEKSDANQNESGNEYDCCQWLPCDT
jgi:hypothetical protein